MRAIDATTPPGFPLWELQAMVRAGLSSREALLTAAAAVADALGLGALGRHRPGFVAEMVLLRRNPLSDLSALGEVAAVVRGGRLAYVAPALNNLWK